MKSLMAITLMALLVASSVSAQENDPLTRAANHYVNELNDAYDRIERCLEWVNYIGSGVEVRSLEEIEKTHCELEYNSRMIQLSIEVQLILAGLSGDIGYRSFDRSVIIR